MNRLMALTQLLSLALAASASSAIWAQDYPTRPVRIIVGFAAGGVTDIMARIMGQKLGESFNQSFIIDNRPGAGSAIASEMTAKAPPDGYTLSMIGTSFAINAGVYKNLKYDPVKDFAGVVLVSAAPQALVANLTLPAKSVKELIELARAKPGQLNFASSGNGSTSHLAGELLKSMAKIDLAHVPYKGGSAAMMADLMSGRVELLFLSLPGALPQIKAGRVRALAVTSTKRSSAAPDVPAVAETIPGYEATSWNGLVVPAATPKPIIAKLNGEVVRLLRRSDVAESITRQGADPLGSTPAEFDTYLKAEVAKWKKLVAQSGVQPD